MAYFFLNFYFKVNKKLIEKYYYCKKTLCNNDTYEKTPKPGFIKSQYRIENVLDVDLSIKKTIFYFKILFSLFFLANKKRSNDEVNNKRFEELLMKADVMSSQIKKIKKENSNIDKNVLRDFIKKIKKKKIINL